MRLLVGSVLRPAAVEEEEEEEEEEECWRRSLRMQG